MLHSRVHSAQSVCPPSWHTPFMPSFDVTIPGTLGQVSHFLLWAPSLPGHASILVITSTVLCFWLFSPKGSAALQGWGQRAYSPSSPQRRGQAGSVFCDSDGIFSAPIFSQLSMESCQCLPRLPLLLRPQPKAARTDHLFHRLDR